MTAYLGGRREQTQARLDEITRQLADAEQIAGGRACVYATGSFARGEASAHSDLDLFIVGTTETRQLDAGCELHTKEVRQLPRLDEIRIKSKLIDVTARLLIPAFSGDGEYLSHYTVADLVKTLGRPEDDVANTFTARLLLLLESRALIGAAVHQRAISDVLQAYWRDYDGHETEFRPAFLINDVLRLWRTFCVNYEARTASVPAEKKAKRKLKNYKLKHSRLLTCYSAVLYLLRCFEREQTVTLDDAGRMCTLTPTQRLEWLAEDAPNHGARVGRTIELYERFLRATDESEDSLVRTFMDKPRSVSLLKQAHEFGDSLYELVSEFREGRSAELFRVLVM